MPRATYTALEYTDMILIYGESQGNKALALRTYRERYGDTRTCPRNPRTIVLAVQRARENKPLVAHQEGVPPQQIPTAREQQILDYFDRNPTLSLHRAACQFRVCRRTVQYMWFHLMPLAFINVVYKIIFRSIIKDKFIIFLSKNIMIFRLYNTHVIS
ncbi:unnamed protein product [Chrysodeixis includens]|uniref:DUF4817 domain-containing protein n=1 Tax=Chrysodeixis includens TaxID=689277 RepID=A0A9N8Q054_CHRIL|nr:unnamed protein product [Chrysodeixis includens]